MASRKQDLATDHELFRSTKRFRGLDGLRALAALAVIFFHFGGPQWDFLQGWIGVHVFFTLSGFLITTLLVRELRRTGRIDLRGFARRRAHRIVPLYVLVLAVTVLASVCLGLYRSSGLEAGLPYYLTFSGELYDHPSPFGIAWSLGVEEKFYVALPLLVAGLGLLLIRGRAARRTVLVVVAVLLLAGATLVTACALDLVQLGDVTYAYVSIVVGTMLALALENPRCFALLRPLRHPLAGLVAGAAFVVLQVHVRGIGATRGDHWQTFVPLYAVAVALLLAAAISQGPLQRLLSGRVLTFVGQRSYGLYLTQFLVGDVVSVALRPAGTVKAVVVALIGIGLAHVLHRTVELPFIERARRGSARASDRATAGRTAAPRHDRAASRPRTAASPATPG